MICDKEPPPPDWKAVSLIKYCIRHNFSIFALKISFPSYVNGQTAAAQRKAVTKLHVSPKIVKKQT